MSHAIHIHDGSGVAITNSLQQPLLIFGATKPTDGVSGYAPGCIFVDTTNGTIYINETTTTADFNRLSSEAAQTFGAITVSSLTSTGAISGTTLTASDTAYIGDTTNAGVTLGLTINQGAADDEILALKSSDVAHGMTVQTETDTYFRVTKFAAADGGAFLDGLCDTGSTGLRLRGVIVTDTATRSTSGIAPVMIDAALKSTTSVADCAADKNILCVRNNGTTRFLLDSDGDSFQDVGTAWTNFSIHDDVGLLSKISAQVSRPDDPLRHRFGEFLEDNRQELEELKLVAFNEDGHHFMNMSRLSMLLTGACIQLGQKLAAMEQSLAKLAGGAAPPAVEGLR